MKWKICGLKYPDNIRQVADEHPDLLGFIFYDASPRYTTVDRIERVVDRIPSSIRKVGVFVNEDRDRILEVYRKLDLDYVQLHGDESPEYVEQLKKKNVRVIKAFRIGQGFHWGTVMDFEGLMEYYLFDTASSAFGGSGRSFDWRLLHHYKGRTSYFLSGGLGPDEIPTIAGYFTDERLIGIDFNSKLEMFPGMKSIYKVQQVHKNLKDEFKI